MMADPRASVAADDPHQLDRFVRVQEADYERAFAELRAGRKRSHWMRYIFPQIQGLGLSATSRLYAIKSLHEARAYLAHPVLGPRLIACFETLLAIRGRSAHDIFGSPDDMKLRSCATLFERVAAPGSVFGRLIDAYFAGERDPATLRLLEGN
jgi:uncharacterized protein (DUF1810 family)